MLNEKNIQIIKEQLIALGLNPEIEYPLRSNICLQPDHFRLSCAQGRNGDVVNIIFYFERKDDEYNCRYYECCLRKKIIIEDTLVNGIDVNELHKRMARIDWEMILSNSGNPEESNWEMIDGIVTDLKQLSSSPEGYFIAERLKVKFWLDTLLISFIHNINTIRNQYEISQRFYFFEGETQINLDEAYRFLCHRWREKQLNVKKKQTDNDGSENGSGDGGKLLQKKSTKGKKFKVSR